MLTIDLTVGRKSTAQAPMAECFSSKASSLISTQRRPRLDGRYLKSAVKMMGRDKEGVDAAMAGFMSMLEDEKDSVPALLGMSLAFTLEGSPNKVCFAELRPLGCAHLLS